MHLDDDDRVLLDRERVECLVVEVLERILTILRGDRIAVGRCEQDRHPTLGLREGRVRGCAAERLTLVVEEAVHPWDPGRDDPLLGDAEGLGVERDIVLGADDRVGVVPVAARPGVRPVRLAQPAVADRLERSGGMPQLDEPHLRGQIHHVDDGLTGALHEDDVGAGERPQCGDALAPRDVPATSPSQEGQVTVESTRHHPVVNELHVPSEGGRAAGHEQDPPTGPSPDGPHRREDESRPARTVQERPSRPAKSTRGGPGVAMSGRAPARRPGGGRRRTEPREA